MDHTADFGLEIFGTDPASLFQQAAMAMTDLIVDAAGLSGLQEKTITVQGDDWDDLLVNWLRELLYCWNGEGELVAKATVVAIEPTRITARVSFDPYEPQRHEIRNEIKAVTYHQAMAGPHGDGWMARIIVDI